MTDTEKRCPRYADCGPMERQEFHDHDGDGDRWDCSAHWTCNRCHYTEHATLVHLKSTQAEPISEARLAEIREADARWHDASPEPSQTSVFRHRAELLAEVDRLTAECDNLATELAEDHLNCARTIAQQRGRIAGIEHVRDEWRGSAKNEAANATRAAQQRDRALAERDQAREIARGLFEFYYPAAHYKGPPTMAWLAEHIGVSALPDWVTGNGDETT